MHGKIQGHMRIPERVIVGPGWCIIGRPMLRSLRRLLLVRVLLFRTGRVLPSPTGRSSRRRVRHHRRRGGLGDEFGVYPSRRDEVRVY